MGCANDKTTNKKISTGLGLRTIVSNCLLTELAGRVCRELLQIDTGTDFYLVPSINIGATMQAPLRLSNNFQTPLSNKALASEAGFGF